MRSPRLRIFGVVALGAMLLLGVACTDDAGSNGSNGSDEGGTTGATASPTSTPIEALPNGPTGGDATGGDTSGAAGGDIEPANPDSPPEGTLASADGEVELGLGTYCWSPPTGSGAPGLCVDAIGIITSTEDLTATAGETLSISGEPGTLPWPPMTIGQATLYPATEPIEAQADFRAWRPEGGGTSIDTEVTTGEHFVTLPGDLEPGEYVLELFYTAGPDRGSDATYGAVIVVE